MISRAIKKSTASFLIVLLYTIPIVWFYFFLFRNSLNIPYGDDYKAILTFLNDFVRSTTSSDKLNLIFSQYHEYRIAFCRIVTLLAYYIYGSINFKALCVISNLSLIGIVYIFYKAFKINRFKYLLFVPSVFLVFHMQYWEASLWSTAALQQFWVLLFALLCFYYLHCESWGYCIVAMFAALCAAYTNGNGIICFIIGLLLLLLRKQFAKSLLWLLFIAVALYFYFYDYEFKTIELPPLDETVIFILSFLGSSISFNTFHISLLFGCFSAIYLIYLTSTAYYQRNPVIYAMILFIVITALAVAIARSHIETYQAIASRYNLNSSLLMLCIYISAVETIAGNHHTSKLLHNKKYLTFFLTSSILLSICFCAASYMINLKYIYSRNRMLVRAVGIWQEKGNGGYLSFPLRFRLNNRYYLKTFTESSQIHAYALPVNLHNDGDGIPYQDDNCPDTYNPFQENADGDGIGDACDRCESNGSNDTDGDGISDAKDNCCFVPNPDQADADGNGIGDVCDSSFIEKHWLEAEQAVTLISPMEVAIDERASGKSYIYSPDGSGNQYTPGPVMAIYKAHILKAGEYILWGRVIAPDLSSDSFFVQMDDGFDNLWTVALGNDWHWSTVNDRGNADIMIFTLGRGEHTIRLKLREDGTKLDTLLLTNGMFTFTPEGKGETAE
jgi:hypothetical protein